MPPDQGVGRPGGGPDVVPRTCDVVVIGSGAYGASVTYHLAAAGQRVVLVDRAGLGTQTSPRAAGLATGVHHTLANSRVAARSMDAFCTFPRDTGQPLRVHRTGSLKVARRAQDVAVLEADLARASRLGLDAELVGADEVARRAPFVDAHEALLACWLPGDLYLDPTQVLRGYLTAAAEHGAGLVGGAPVRTVVPGAGGGLTTVLSDGRTIDSAAVVNAAGAWIRELAARSGVVVPALPIRHQLLVTQPVPGVSADQPCVRVVDTAAYVRPERDGLLFGAYEPDPVQPQPGQVGAGVQHMPLDAEPLLRVARRSGIPALGTTDVAELRGGYPTMTPDGDWVVDEAAGLPGYFVIGGDNVGGLSTAPALGADLARWIGARGRRPASLEAYRLDRFDAADLDEERLRARCLGTYVTRYGRPVSVA